MFGNASSYEFALFKKTQFGNQFCASSFCKTKMASRNYNVRCTKNVQNANGNMACTTKLCDKLTQLKSLLM